MFRSVQALPFQSIEPLPLLSFIISHWFISSFTSFSISHRLVSLSLYRPLLHTVSSTSLTTLRFLRHLLSPFPCTCLLCLCFLSPVPSTCSLRSRPFTGSFHPYVPYKYPSLGSSTSVFQNRPRQSFFLYLLVPLYIYPILVSLCV